MRWQRKQEIMNNENIILQKDGDGNTRLMRESKLHVHCDYLRVTANALTTSAFECLLHFLDKNYIVSVEHPWSPGSGAIWFDNKISSAKGMVGGWDVDDDGHINCMFDMSGEYFEAISPENQWRLFRGLKYAYQVRCCRIDLAIDDESYELIPIASMRKAYHDSYNFGFRKYRQHITYESPSSPAQITDEFGSRNSGRFVRVYDHEGECLRFEAEFKRGYAPEIFDYLAELERPETIKELTKEDLEFITEENCNEEWNISVQRFMAGLALGAIDFRDRGNSKSAKKAGTKDSKRCKFYQDFVDLMQANLFKVKLAKIPRTAQKTFEWLKRQCSGSLAMFKKGLGAPAFFIWINQLLEYGNEKMDKVKCIMSSEIFSCKHQFVIRS